MTKEYNITAHSCKVIDVNECDCLYQVKYYRVCYRCGEQEKGLKERTFPAVLKNGESMNIDNWTCPNCGELNISKVWVNKDK